MAIPTSPEGVEAPPTALERDEFNRRLVLSGCGRRVSYADVGNPHGLPVLFLYGQGGHRHVSYLFHHLARLHGIRLLCIDRPGYGLSDDVSIEGNVPHPTAFAAIVREFLDALSIKRLGLMAHSAGCIYALALAAQPSLAARLVEPVMLIAPWVGLENPHMPRYLKVAAYCPDVLIAATFRLLDASTSLSSFSGAGPNNKVHALGASINQGATADDTQDLLLDKETCATTAQSLSIPLSDFERRIHSETNNNYHDALVCLGRSPAGVGFILDQVHTHVHVFHGEKDALVPLQAAEVFVAQLPHADLIVVKGGTHVIHSRESVISQAFEVLATAAAVADSQEEQWPA
ncbi:Aste57867_15172 [Aphanomyces stellatus]|uniref:Aste57867_15172 protein n=1 Tax=Aphanomyces stellatus TaxID=120398 RepID=A0A485L2I9_9STRA|nr:hypothetical protein As57867_015116 [Aphanomyces stellatus]VFT91981.1 Aste57867_15172 [Aphanomyces stellatus]